MAIGKYAVRILMTFEIDTPWSEVEHLAGRCADLARDTFDDAEGVNRRSIEVSYGAFPEGCDEYADIHRINEEEKRAAIDARSGR